MSEYSQGELLSATYDVWIKGNKLNEYKKECITSLEVSETVEEADTATLNISDPNFEYIEDNIFVEDSKIKIEIGWDGYTYRSVFSGYITAIDIDFKDDGVPELVIHCMDETHRMNREKNSKTWNNTTSAKVIEEIVRKYGFGFVCEKGYKFTTQETITQSSQTDIEFIQSLASEETALFTARLVDNKTFHYVKMGTIGDAKMSLNYVNYPHEVISFSPSINIETRQSNVSSGNVSDNKEVETVKITSETSSGNTSNSLKSGGNAGQVNYSAHTGAYTSK